MNWQARTAAARRAPALGSLLLLVVFTSAVLTSSGLAVGPLVAPTSAGEPAPPSAVVHPEWSSNLAIYEVNLRHYTPGGTFKEFEAHLPRIKQMGVGILWFMPIHPIGEKGRKGTLGSYYSVKDYIAVNPDYGTLDEFKALVARIHEMGIYVIIDWVANHTAWDNPMVFEHPEWFTKDTNGNMKPPVADWSDVADLDYGNAELRRYMIDAMKFWVREADIDGFRCDVAEMVPLDFWSAARAELDAIKPVFMLAEGETPALHLNGFDATYGWSFFKLTRRLAESTASAVDLWGYFNADASAYPADALRMYFTSNHDENSWNGTARQFFGDGLEAFVVLTATARGIPLIYSGEEAGLSRRLAFFDKDSILWREHKLGDLYTALLHLKRTNRALWNGNLGGRMVRIPTSNDGAIFAFVRTAGGIAGDPSAGEDRVVVVINFSTRTQDIELRGRIFTGTYGDVLSGEQVTLGAHARLKLKPWTCRILASGGTKDVPQAVPSLAPATRAIGAEVQPDEQCASPPASKEVTPPDLGVLIDWMTGSFSSAEQAAADTNYHDIRLEMARIWNELPGACWLYVEQAVAGREDKPYRQRVYRVTPNPDGTLRSEVYSFRDPLRFAGDWRRPAPLAELLPDSLEVRVGCAVILRRVDETAFEGRTVGKECTSEHRGAAYATSEVRVTPEGITTWDRGYDSEGNQVWGSVQGGYVFEKTTTEPPAGR